jgi:CheY-like chemotaxis protein
MLSRRLTRRGHDVLTAIDGQEAVDRARADQPDIILMDMSLPVLDGWEATERIKQHEATKKIPVIALTAHALSSDRTRALEAGCDEFETKPIEFDKLMAKINAFLPHE